MSKGSNQILRTEDNIWCLSPWNPELISFETSFSLYIPLTHRIFISVQALDYKIEPKSTFSPNMQIWDLNHAHSLMSMQ